MRRSTALAAFVAALLLTTGCGRTGVNRPPPTVTQSPSTSARPSPQSDQACLTADEFYDLVKDSFDDSTAYKVYGDVLCQDGWATGTVGATPPVEDQENAYYLLQLTGGKWVVVDMGTESWLFVQKPLCQRVPDRIAARLCLNSS